MFLRLSFLAAVSTASASDPMLQVSLAPAEDAGAGFAEGFQKEEARLEAQGLNSLRSAEALALQNAKAKIDAAIHGGSSFLGLKNDIYIKVADSPATIAQARAAKLEGLRNTMESRVIAQSASEFGALTDVVVEQLKRAMHQSFLGKNSMDVKLKASDIAWPSTLSLMRSVEGARDRNERRVYSDDIITLQKGYLRSLNGLIRQSLAAM